MITQKNQKIIFIVDDDEFFAQVLKDHLEKSPKYIVELYSTGEECLNELDKKPDLIILDFYLNKVNKEAANGLEILKKIKRNNNHQNVIMLSGQEQYGIALQTMAKGAEKYVMKDKSSFSEIDTIIKELLRR